MKSFTKVSNSSLHSFLKEGESEAEADQHNWLNTQQQLELDQMLSRFPMVFQEL